MRANVISAMTSVAIAVTLLPLHASATVSFELTIDDPGGANAAHYAGIQSNFAAAAAEWSTHFAGNADLQVVLTFETTYPRLNGSSVTTSFVGNDGTTPVYEQGAAAEIRTGNDPNGANFDINLFANPDYVANNLWFDPDPTTRTTPIPPNRTDAVSVFLHELGHAFAFNGWRDNFNGTLPAYESTFDRLTTYDGSNFYFNGPLATAMYGGPVPLTYGNIFHFGNAAPGPGSDLVPDLMNGVVFYYDTRYDISTLDLLTLADTGLPVTNVPVQWNGSAGNWSNAAQWSTRAIVPNGNVTNATFAVTIPSGFVILDLDVSLQSLTLASSATLTGARKLTLAAGTINGAFNTTGTTTINTGTLTFASPDASAAAIAGTGNLAVAGLLTSDGVQIAGTWTVNGTHVIRSNGTSSGTSKAGVLILAGSLNNWTGQLDLTNNKLIVEDAITHALSLATIQNEVAFGRTHTAGLRSSVLPPRTTLAVLDNAITHFTSFGSLSADADSILVGPELLGDANADGKVDASDLNTVLNHIGAVTPSWTSGNFDGAQTIDLTDLAYVLNNFGLTYSSPSTQDTGLKTQDSVPAPEPASLVLFFPLIFLLRPGHLQNRNSRSPRSRNNFPTIAL